MKVPQLLLFTPLLLASCHSGSQTTQPVADSTDYTVMVDPKIGSGGHGHVLDRKSVV